MIGEWDRLISYLSEQHLKSGLKSVVDLDLTIGYVGLNSSSSGKDEGHVQRSDNMAAMGG